MANYNFNISDFNLNYDAGIQLLDGTNVSTRYLHSSFNGVGDGTVDTYTFTVKANETFIFDIDDNNFDTVLSLYDSSNNLISENDDSTETGHTGGDYPSFLSYTFANGGTYTLKVSNYSGTNLTSADNYKLNVTNVNERPTGITVNPNSIAENVANNTAIGVFNTSDPDTGNTFTYSLVTGTGDTDNSAFSIVGNQLQINNSPDYETKNSYSIRVRTTDQGNLSYEQALTINVSNVNETPTALTLSNNAIAENVANNTAIGVFNTSDPDTGNTFTYSLITGTGDTDNSAFSIVGNQLQINSSPDFETKNSYSIRVRTTDQGGLSYEQALTINITNVNDTPTGSVTINGIAKEGKTLTISNTLADEDGLGTFNYQWQQSSNGINWTNINGETSNSLTLTNNQLNQQIRFQVTYIDGNSTLETVFSDATQAVLPPQPGVIEFEYESSTVEETDANFALTGNLIRTGGSDGRVSVTVTPYDVTALSGQDYDYTPQIITFEDGETIKPFSINILGDTIPENNETFNLTLSNPSNNATLGDKQNLGIQINDNDNRLVSISHPRVIEGGDSRNFVSDVVLNNLVFVISLSDPAPQGSIISYSTVDGTATANVDYQPVSGTYTFAEGETSFQVTVPIIADFTQENSETVLLKAIEVSNGLVIDEFTDGVGTIINDDYKAYGVNGVVVGQLRVNGKGLDGPISGATVFFDTNLNGILDGDEPSTTTDSTGNYQLEISNSFDLDLNSNGTIDPNEAQIVLVGGTDAITGQAFTGTLKAPTGSTVITPLTNLISELIAVGLTFEEAETNLETALGLPDLNLITFDPLEAAQNGSADGLKVLSTQIALQTLINGMDAIAENISLYAPTVTPEIWNNSFKIALLGAIQSGNLDLGDSQQIANILYTTGNIITNGDSTLEQQFQSLVNVIPASSQIIAGGFNNIILNATNATDIFKAQTVAQTTITGDYNASLQGQIPFSTVVENNTGENLTNKVENAVINVLAVAVDDSFNANEDHVFNGNVITNDSSIGGGSLTITAVEGLDTNVGQNVILASGAIISVNADGTFTYNPNGKFEDLKTGETDTDTFKYSLTSGTTTDLATVTITINGVNDLLLSEADDYIASYPDLIQAFGYNLDAGIQHYINHGYAEGRVTDNFDEQTYLNSYSDLKNAFGNDLDAATRHYIEFGYNEGRDPLLGFNGGTYIASYSDLISAFGYNPNAGKEHYRSNGYQEGRNITFEADDYIASNSDLIQAFGNNLNAGTQHYITNGYTEGRVTDNFDEQAYLNSYSDLKNAFGNDLDAATRHYIEFGYNEGRDPLLGFNGGTYIASYSDLISAFGYNPNAGKEHYRSNGYQEGRNITFEADDYIASYGDLIQAFGYNLDTATQHYISYGYQEGRNITFEADDYIASNGDLIQAFGYNLDTATQHYISYGYQEGRNITFEADDYIASNGDLIQAFGNNLDAATEHYINHGYVEGRVTDNFDEQAYLNSYSDLKNAFGNDLDAATRHYLEFGYNEGRDPLLGFNGGTYIASYGDLIQAFGYNPNAGKEHYRSNGYQEGRNITFEADDYIASYGDLIQAFGYNLDTATQHYISYGYQEGRNITFEADDYIASNGDLIQAFGYNLDAATEH
jgi:VCBS repeat-containing protein